MRGASAAEAILIFVGAATTHRAKFKCQKGCKSAAAGRSVPVLLRAGHRLVSRSSGRSRQSGGDCAEKKKGKSERASGTSDGDGGDSRADRGPGEAPGPRDPRRTYRTTTHASHA